MDPGRGAGLLILSQIFSKLLTFILNQVLIRLISPSLFGVAAHLEFLYQTILFFSREAQRLSIQRTKPHKDEQQTFRSILNFGVVPFIIGIPISTIIMSWQFKSDTFREVSQLADGFYIVVGMYWLLTILELLIEPIYSLNQYKLNFAARSKYEGTAVLFRCLTNIAVTLLVKLDVPLTRNGLLLFGFGLGQLVYSLTLFICYLSSFSNKKDLCPKRLKNNELVDRDVWSFWKISFIQMIFKQFLTEGDKFLVNAFFSVEERGVYSVMNNYGSIIVRLLFQPVEESVRLSFTKVFANKDTLEKSLASSIKTIKFLLIFYMQLSIMIILAGFFNASFLLKFLLGGKSSAWLQTDLFQLFPWYITYIPFLALNGVLEAVFTATANSSQTKTYSYFMSGLSILILILLYVFVEKLDLGIFGLILANCINMVSRILYCSCFLIEFFKKHSVNINIRSIASLVTENLAIAGISFYTNYVILGVTGTFTDLFKSAIICLVCLLSLLFTVKNDLQPILNRVLHRKKD